MNSVKNRIALILAICLFITSAVFLLLWQKEKHDDSDLRNIAASAASACRDAFWKYEETEDQYYYYSGVAEFCTFNTVYGQLVNNTNDSANALFCNEVYGILTTSPEKCMAKINRLIAVTEKLALDIDDPNAYTVMADLRYSLKE